ncbi:TetR/AcrR family transcriptional regulator [Novosphingobium sp. ERN07]|uniref:TetR/AcrR family transcriptional regulator n=1 Tax=Novosphingobium sp. ERN07 TaxID=2726187 RepID=UPI0017F93B30|nr:TetR/AcrR family transcriptional regulator [Novosphingobium sp. ERN07]NLR73197.1 TetR/AcrR family transcriptional regulator [Novosphingobium sp. ERN07]
MAPPDAGPQQRKSAETRVTILKAAIDCLARVGYARTTTQLIAKVAKMSRGAMLHHYSTKQELIESVTDYAFLRHLEQFIAAVRELPEVERTRDNIGILIDWRLYQSAEYSAYLELTVAARTDAELRAMFVLKAQRHDRVWREELERVFPEWAGDPERLSRSRRLVQTVMSGMVLNREIWDDPAMERALLAFLAATLLKIRDGELDWPEWDEVGLSPAA